MLKKVVFKLLYQLPNVFFPFVLEYILKFYSIKSLRNEGMIFVNTHDRSGGASKIAYQLASHIKQKQLVEMFVKYKDRNEDWIHKIDSNEEILGIEFSNYLNDQEKEGGWLDFSKISFMKYLNLPQVINSKKIHLHNLHGGYFSYALLPYLSRKKRLIWTLHDEHALTGHCSFTMKCENWKSNCFTCEHLSVYPAINYDNTKMLKKFKERWIKKSRITFVTPSFWLADRLKQTYPFLKDIHVIPNGIDCSVFTQKNKHESRLKFDLPTDKFLVLFIAEYATDNPFKGGETIRELIDLNMNKNILFVTIGGKSQNFNSSFIELPYVKNDDDLASLYSACDLMLYPTNADNHPLVVMEAMSCKLPVLAPKIGGIPEIITKGLDSWLVDSYAKPEVYMEVLNQIYELKLVNDQYFQTFGDNARKKIESTFTLEQMIKGYEDLYFKA